MNMSQWHNQKMLRRNIENLHESNSLIFELKTISVVLIPFKYIDSWRFPFSCIDVHIEIEAVNFTKFQDLYETGVVN